MTQPDANQPGPPPQPHIMMVHRPPTSAFAVASLVFGIIGIFLGWCTFATPCVVAVICGHAGLIDTRGSAKSGRGMAIAGLILGYLVIAPTIVLVLVGQGSALFR